MIYALAVRIRTLDSNLTKVVKRASARDGDLLRNLTLTALLSFVIVLGAFQILFGPSPNPSYTGLIEHSGANVMSRVTLEIHVALPEHLDWGYWIGPKDGASYSADCITRGLLQVSYIKASKTESSSNDPMPLLTISTYENKKSLPNLSPIGERYDNTIARNTHGDVISYNKVRMDKLIVFPANSDKVVIFNYSSAQELAAMVKDSDQLVTVPSPPKAHIPA